MYNGQQVRDLIKKQGLKVSDLAQALYNDPTRSLTPIVSGNPTATTLEAVADFLKVPIDVFFNRKITVTNEAELPASAPSETYVTLLIASKDAMIKNLEEQVALLRKENKSLRRKQSGKKE